MPWVIAFGLAGYGLPAHAATTDIVQITVNSQVEQSITTYRGDPNFADHNNPFLADPFIFFDQHVDILRNQANVWDPSQIPTAPNEALVGQDYSVNSIGTLTGTWTFDASVLAQSLDGLSDSDGTLLGTTSNVSSFEVVSMGVEVVNAATSISRVLVRDDWAVGVDGEVLDVIAIQADTPAVEGSVTEGVTLLLGGGANWFEDAAGGIPDFNAIIVAQIEYEESIFVDDGIVDEYGDPVALYSETVNGDLTGDSLSIKSFGEANGASEDSPLLPTTVSQTEDGAATFGFDVSVAGADFVFVDPEIAVGYTYEIEGAGEITGIKAPSEEAVNDPDGYTVTLPDGTTFTLLPGDEVEFGTGVKSLVLSGIDPSLLLDPLDNTTFVAGFLLSGTSGGSVLTQTPTVVDTDSFSAVPLPPSAALLLGSLGLFGFVARRRRAV